MDLYLSAMIEVNCGHTESIKAQFTSSGPNQPYKCSNHIDMEQVQKNWMPTTSTMLAFGVNTATNIYVVALKIRTSMYVWEDVI